MAYAARAVRGVSVVFLAGILASAAAYLLRIILARTLLPEDYGLFYAVFTFVILLLFFRDWGFHSALTRHIPLFLAQKKGDDLKTAVYSTFTLQFLASIALALALWILAPSLAESYFKNPQALLLLRILVFYVITSALFRVMKAMFQGFQKMAAFSLFELLKNSLVSAIAIALLLLSFGVFAPAIGYVLAPLLVFLFFLPSSRSLFLFSAHSIKNTVTISKALFSFGFAVTITSVGGKVIGYIDTLMLTFFTSLEQVGIYNTALPSALFLIFIGKSAVEVLFPLVSEMHAKSEQDKIGQACRFLHRHMFSVFLPVTIFLIFYSRELLLLLFGPAYASGAFSLQILLVGTLLYLTSSINTTVLSSMGRPKEVSIIVLGAAAFNIILNLSFIPALGIVGAALATSASYTCIYALSSWRVRKRIDTSLPLSFWLRLSIAAILFGALLFLLKSSLGTSLPALAATIAVAALFYLALTYYLKLIRWKQLLHLALQRRKED